MKEDVTHVYMIALLSEDYAYVMLDGTKGDVEHHMIQATTLEKALYPFREIIKRMSDGEISSLITGMILIDHLNVHILKLGVGELEEMRKYLPKDGQGNSMMKGATLSMQGEECPTPLAVFEKEIIDRWSHTTLKKYAAGNVLKKFKDLFSEELKDAPQELKDKLEKLIQQVETEEVSSNKKAKTDFKFSDN